MLAPRRALGRKRQLTAGVAARGTHGGGLGRHGRTPHLAALCSFTPTPPANPQLSVPLVLARPNSPYRQHRVCACSHEARHPRHPAPTHGTTCLLPVLCVDLPPLIRTLPASTARATAMPAVCFQFDETPVSSVPSCPCSLLMGVWKPTGVVEDAQCGSGRAGGISFACSPAVNLVNLVRRIAPHARACTVRMARGPLPILSPRTLRAGAVVAARRGTVRGCGRPRLGYSR